MSFVSTVPLPSPDDVNRGLTSPGQHTMIHFFGVPGELTADCSESTDDKVKAMLTSISIGGRDYKGLAPFLALVEKAIDKTELSQPGIREALRCDGVICVRHQHGFPDVFSNHSWGTAIDLFFGNGPVSQGVPFTQSGILDLYTQMHDEGLYWGGGYHNRSRVDSMHFEASEELLVKWHSEGLI